MKLEWKVPIEDIDVAFYLPLFASGLRELEFPYSFLAEEGFSNMLDVFPPQKIASIVPLLIAPLRDAVNTRQSQPLVRTLRSMKKLASLGGGDVLGGDGGAAGHAAGHSPTLIGAALLPYYRQLLPTLNLFAQRNLNLGDGIDYGQRFNRSIGESIAEFLHILDVTGGEAAYLNILYSVPTYIRSV